MSNSDIRRAFRDVLRAFFNKKIIFPLITMLAYIFLITIAFKKIGFWDLSATKDTILWTLGTAVTTYFGLNKVAQDNDYFRNAILDNFKFVLILEFIVNFYSFNLITEIILIPIATFIVMLNTVAKTRAEYKQVNKFLNFVLGVFGLFLLGFTFREMILDFQNFATLKSLRDFLLPPLFSIALLPFIYVMALFMQYELFFVRIEIANKDSNFAKMVKRKVFATCNINLSKLTKVSKKAGYPKVNSQDDILEWLK